MTQESTPFPNHQFDFADVVFVLPLHENGTVKGILYREKLWYYLITLSSASDSWWREDQLAFTAPESLPARESPPAIAVEPLPKDF